MNVKDTVLQGAFSLGVDELLIDAYNTYSGSETVGEAEIERITDIVDEQIRQYTLPSDERNGAVFLPLTQGHMNNASAYNHCLLAHAFRVRGYEPLLTLCRNDMALCRRKSPYNDGTHACAKCHRYGNRLLEAFGISPLEISDVLSEDYTVPSLAQFDDIGEVTYEGIDVSGFAESSTRRFLKKSRIRRRNERDWAYYKRFLRSCLLLVDVAMAVVESYDVVATLSNSPAYLTGGVPLAVSSAHGITSVPFSKGYSDGKMLFGDFENRSAQPQFTAKPFVDEVLEQPISAAEQTDIDEIMEGRMTGKTARRHHTAEATESLTDSDRQTIGLFTNVAWDAALETKDIVFDNSYTWIGSTIEYVADLPDVEVIVKVHPGEMRADTREVARIDTWIDENFDELPDNVQILPPDTDVDPYKMMRTLDAGVVYTSTVGIELAYLGTPSIMVSDSHYRDLGFTFDPESVQEYFEFLDDVKSLTVTDEMRQRVERYIHLLFVRKHIDFPFYRTDPEDLSIELLPVTHEELRDPDTELDFAIKRILDADPVVKPLKVEGDRASL